MILENDQASIRDLSAAFVTQFEKWAEAYLSEKSKSENFVGPLWESKSYSFLLGGKRFRPFLTSLVYQIWNQDSEKIKNFCLAIEMVHTYSLIHDDLPCMDNDDLRRGKPTNHKVYGEAIALLAGDSLLTEAFNLISTDAKLSAEVKIKLIRLLSDKAGAFGMVGGQVLDINATSDMQLMQLEKIHLLKTGYLIQAAAVGAAIIAEASEAEEKATSLFAVNLGLAFQIKDDLLDGLDPKQDHKSYLSMLGEANAILQMDTKSKEAKSQAMKLDSKNTKKLIDLVDYNIQRIR